MPADSGILKTQNSFYWEDSTVDVAGASDDLALFRKQCDALREVINQTWTQKQAGEKVNSANFASLVLSIKELNRKTQFRIRKARERTSEQKCNVDKLHLSLQNLLYEVAHLENDIKTCLEFKSQHEKLSLIPLEEFCKATGRPFQEQLSHEETLERLYWELEQRKNWSASCEKLMQSVESISQEIAQKRKYLSNFAPKLKELVDNTLVVQKLMDLPFTKEDEQHRLAFLLPAPLYILYAHLKSYLCMMNTLPHATVEIEGDGELAKAVNQAAATNPASETGASPDADESDTEDAIEEKKRKAKRHKGEGSTHAPTEVAAKAISLHPLRVLLRLWHPSHEKPTKNKQQIQLTLSFAWITHPGLVTVRMRVRPAESAQLDQQSTDPLDDPVPRSVSASDLLRSESLLFNLCSQPDRPIVDMPALPAGLLRAPVQWGACEPIGRPYLWAQQLAGLQPLPEVAGTSAAVGSKATDIMDGDSRGGGGGGGVTGVLSDSGSNSARFGQLDLWLRAVHQRLTDRVNLIREIAAIETGRPSLSPEQQKLLPPGIDVRLVNWKRSAMPALENVPRARKLIALLLIQSSDAIFRCEFHRSDQTPVPVWVAVPPEYPNKAPLLVVDNAAVTAAMATRTKKVTGALELSDLHLHDLEAEVNCYWSEFFPNEDPQPSTTATHMEDDDGYKLTSPIRNILSCQLARCAACLYALGQGDVSSSSSLPADSSRIIRYPTRSRPLRYLPSLGIFTHR